MPIVGDELHHMGWNACSSCRDKPGVRTHNYLVLGAVLSGNVYFVDVKTDPKAPRIFKVAVSLYDKEFAVPIRHT